MAATETKTDQEPSIEEILESIRQIISEDGTAPPAADTKPAPSPLSLSPEQVQAHKSSLDLSVENAAPDHSSLDLSVQAQDMDVLELTDAVTPPQTTAPEPQTEEVVLEMLDNPIVEQPMTNETPSADSLLSAQTAEAAAESFSKLLAGNVAVEREDVGRAGKVTLEDMTRELMKPLIKTWLDQNLPGLIEKVVQKEIEKLSRRAVDR